MLKDKENIVTMKILQLCSKVPFPPQDGGCIAMNNITQGLINEGHSVKVIAMNTKKHHIEIKNITTNYRSTTNIETVNINTEIKIIAAFLNLFTNKSYNIERFRSKNFEQKLIDVLHSENFDIIQIEGLYVSMYTKIIRKYSTAKIIFRAHNVEYLLWEQLMQIEKNYFKKVYLKLLSKRLKKYELSCLQNFDAIATITKKDELQFKKDGFINKIETFPFGIDLNFSFPNLPIEQEYPSLFHLGAMDWKPNTEGVSWFLNHVWILLQKKHPSLKLYLAGRNMSDEMKKITTANVIVVGEIENSQLFMQSKGIMIVPLLSGGGMRVKIIEGMALGKTIITTSIGAEGIDCESNKNCIIANEPIEFAEAISKCISDKIFYSEIGINAKKLAILHYNNADICKRLIGFYKKLLNQNT